MQRKGRKSKGQELFESDQGVIEGTHTNTVLRLQERKQTNEKRAPISESMCFFLRRNVQVFVFPFPGDPSVTSDPGKSHCLLIQKQSELHFICPWRAFLFKRWAHTLECLCLNAHMADTSHSLYINCPERPHRKEVVEAVVCLYGDRP